MHLVIHRDLQSLVVSADTFQVQSGSYTHRFDARVKGKKHDRRKSIWDPTSVRCDLWRNASSKYSPFNRKSFNIQIKPSQPSFSFVRVQVCFSSGIVSNVRNNMHFRFYTIAILISTTAKGIPQYPPHGIDGINSISSNSEVNFDSENPPSTLDDPKELASVQMAPIRTDLSNSPNNFQQDDICPRQAPAKEGKPEVPFRRPVCCRSWVFTNPTKQGKNCWWVESWETMCLPGDMECCTPIPDSNLNKRDTDIGIDCVPILGLPDHIDPHPPSFQQTNPNHRSCPVPLRS